MYTMKDACAQTGLSYETLKFYCNQGLVPNVKRDDRNRQRHDLSAAPNKQRSNPLHS